MRAQAPLVLLFAAAACSSATTSTGGDMSTCMFPALDPYGIVSDGHDVYWSVQGGTIWRASLSGGDQTQLAQLPIDDPDDGFPHGMAMDAHALYVAGMHIWRVPLDGGAPTALATALGGAHGIAVTSDSVYFTGRGLLRVPIGGGEPTTVVPPPPTGGGCAEAVFVSSTDVYFTDECEGALYKVPLTGGGVTVIEAAQTAPYGTSHAVLGVDADHLYWQSFHATIERMPIAGGALETLAPTTADYVTGIAVDANGVYWIETSGFAKAATLRRVSLAGGPAETLAQLPFAGALAVGPSTIVVVSGTTCLTVIPR